MISIIVTPIALVFGLFSAGGGHGNYVLARILFPWTMLSTASTDSITDPFFALAVAQFPIYGVALAVASLAGRERHASILLAIVHIIGVILSFLLANPNFTG